MTTTELRLSGDGIACGGAFEQWPDLECELEPVVAGGIGLLVTAGDRSTIEAALGADPTVPDLEWIAAGEGWALYEVGFAGAFATLFEAVADRRGTVLEAAGRSGAWTVSLRLLRREDAREIYAGLVEAGIEVEVLRLSEPTAAGVPSGLTAEQYEALAAGIEGGYFEIPRRVSLAELADELGISHQALSERFRRAYRTLVSSELGDGAAATMA
ncbi:helix-turn-helix domain-containing protein [Saliphagus infecundisoli]|uniref:Helix-turn-helix domain-containing protein n=1 Tax=Saliphagus infecundisoli TaxID=1849069 RepID=A0ABD5QDJ3_9EURY|nr:helix-turn-helix domain-containing protein [Saliphagus infecundisoli]